MNGTTNPASSMERFVGGVLGAIASLAGAVYLYRSDGLSVLPVLLVLYAIAFFVSFWRSERHFEFVFSGSTALAIAFNVAFGFVVGCVAVPSRLGNGGVVRLDSSPIAFWLIQAFMIGISALLFLWTLRSAQRAFRLSGRDA